MNEADDSMFAPELSPREVSIGLLDYGLFAEKIPHCFVSEGLSKFAETELADLFKETDEKKLKKALDKRCHDYIKYSALRDVNIPRGMGIPHPESYAVQALAISKHWHAIDAHCNMPNYRASRIRIRHTDGLRIFEMNYKGVDRFQYDEDELAWMTRARYIVKTDIATCFPSIYSHSIPWALMGIDEAKKSSNRGILKHYGNLLDICTRNMKDAQTNGLIIGPHSSNIISEIILTKIDKELQDKGYTTYTRNIDDYEFYADSCEAAESFIRDYIILLRQYEMSANDKKTRILSLPMPVDELWVRRLNRFAFPQDKPVKYSTVRAFLDLALECSSSDGKSTPINYAIKVLAGQNLDDRAKRLYTQEAINLTMAYPYLVPLLEKYVFDKFWNHSTKTQISTFVDAVLDRGIKRVYTDAISYALLYSMKYDAPIMQDNEEERNRLFDNFIAMDDCVSLCMLWKYAELHKIDCVRNSIVAHASKLRKMGPRYQDRYWLLLYFACSSEELDSCGQSFLATLKRSDFNFYKKPERQEVA